MKNSSKAIIYILISAFAFTLMSTGVKLAGNIPTYEKVFFRNFINFLVVLFILKKDNISFWGVKGNRKFLAIRGLLGLCGMLFNFYTIAHMSLADSSLLFNMTPFFVILFAFFFLKENIKQIEIIALIGAFIAVLLVIKPQFNLGLTAGLAGLLGAACAGGSYTLISHINKTENPSTIIFYFTGISVLITFPLMMLNFVKPTGMQLVWLLGTGVVATVGQFMVTLAYKYGKASEIAIYNYTSIIFAMGMGYLVWGEIPDMWSILGGTILVSTGAMLYMKKNNNL